MFVSPAQWPDRFGVGDLRLTPWYRRVLELSIIRSVIATRHSAALALRVVTP